MSANVDADLQQPQSTGKSKKHKKKKSKAANAAKPNGDAQQANGATTEPVEEENEDDNPDREHTEEPASPTHNNAPTEEKPPSTARRKSSVALNGQDVKGINHSQYADPTETANRLEVAVKEREQLREEVTGLRKQLENIQSKHNDAQEGLRKEAEHARTSKDLAESKYTKLLGQVNNIKTQLGERLKADAAELENERARNTTLQASHKQLEDDRATLQDELSTLKSERAQQNKEVESLRGRTSLSQQNWAKERDDLVSREASAREEFEAARQAMQDWEVLAMEERALREGLSERVAELEDALNTQRESYDRAVTERDAQSSTVDSLQRALKEVHDARKEERRELVESSQSQTDSLRSQLTTAESSLKTAQDSLAALQSDTARIAPLEKEVREKSLLMGKVRHENVILNDHLTKALRFLKRAKPDDNVDRQLVTNHFLQFLSLERSDPKKFQILQLISALLGWSDEQKEQAGLSRPGASNNSGALKVPLSAPFRRVSSSSGLNPLSPGPSTGSSSGGLRSASESVSSPARGEGLAELWSEFLEREAEEGSGGQRSRRSSLKRGGSGASTPTLRSREMPVSPTESPGVNVQKTRLDSVGEDERGGGEG